MKASRDDLVRTLAGTAALLRGMTLDRLLPPDTRATCARRAAEIDAITEREEDEE